MKSNWWTSRSDAVANKLIAYAGASIVPQLVTAPPFMATNVVIGVSERAIPGLLNGTCQEQHQATAFAEMCLRQKVEDWLSEGNVWYDHVRISLLPPESQDEITVSWAWNDLIPNGRIVRWRKGL